MLPLVAVHVCVGGGGGGRGGDIVVEKVPAADEFIPLSCQLLVNTGSIVNPYQQLNMPYQVDSSLILVRNRQYTC